MTIETCDVEHLPEADNFTHLVLANKKFVGYLTVDEAGYHYRPAWSFTDHNDIIGPKPNGQFGFFGHHSKKTYHTKTAEEMKAKIKEVLGCYDE